MVKRDSAPRFGSHEPASRQASEIKQKTPRKDTRAELQLRRALWRRGARYRLHADELPGKPDLVFRGRKVAVFVDGDFWHGRDWPTLREKLARRHNASYWLAKISYNRDRDQRNTERLQDNGWCVLRFWESDVKADPSAVAETVLSTLSAQRPTARGSAPSSNSSPR